MKKGAKFICAAAVALSAGLATAVYAGDKKPAVEPWPESRSAESFDVLLDKVFSGDPGGDGWGVLDMAPVVSFPALSEAEIKRLFAGNSIRSDDGTSLLYFGADGSVEGFIESEKNLKGTWTIQNGLLCLDLNTTKYKIGCNYTALIIDRVVFFKPNGKARFNGLIKQGKVK